MRQEKEAKETDESDEKMERERTERNKEVNTRAGEGTFPLGLVTMLFLALFDCGCAEHKTVLKCVSGCLRARKERNTEREQGDNVRTELNTGLKTQG